MRHIWLPQGMAHILYINTANIKSIHVVSKAVINIKRLTTIYVDEWRKFSILG